MIEKIKKWWERYWDWLWGLDVIPGIPVLLITVGIPVILFFQLLGIVLGTHHKNNCLDSRYIRRWEENNWICEEYRDNRWIKVDPLEEKPIYHYNEIEQKIAE